MLFSTALSASAVDMELSRQSGTLSRRIGSLRLNRYHGAGCAAGAAMTAADVMGVSCGKSAMRIGIFGGSFDPVHYGHLLLAESCREQCRLDEVRFVPAALPPHKRSDDRAETRHRVAMLELAIAGNPAFRVCGIEIDRGGVSFTVDTLAEILSQQPDAQLFLLLGGDAVQDFPTWREPQRILAMATPVAVSRVGSPSPDFSVLAGLVASARLDEIRRHTVEMPLVEFSSTEIRRRVAAGRSIRYTTPRAVEMYVSEHRLYRPENAGERRGVSPT